MLQEMAAAALEHRTSWQGWAGWDQEGTAQCPTLSLCPSCKDFFTELQKDGLSIKQETSRRKLFEKQYRIFYLNNKKKIYERKTRLYSALKSKGDKDFSNQCFKSHGMNFLKEEFSFICIPCFSHIIHLRRMIREQRRLLAFSKLSSHSGAESA